MKTCPNCGYVDRRMGNLSYEKFMIFWNAYPRKVGKGAAERVWEKMKGDDVLFDRIMAAVENQKQGESWKKDNGVYIPYPATWLHQKRWEDEQVVPWKDPFEKPAFDPSRFEAKKAELERIREREYQRLHGGQSTDARPGQNRGEETIAS